MELKSVASVDRALGVLEAFRMESAVLTLTEIADRVSMHKSTTLRLLETLEARHYVERDANGHYHVGVKALQLATLYQEAVQPHDVIMPVLKDLVKATRESASYNVSRGSQRVCVYRVDSPRRIRDHIRPGDILPGNRGSAGRVFEAFLQPDRSNQRVRERMLAFTVGELDNDTAGIAAPVFSLGDTLEGALAVSGPRMRFDKPAVSLIERLLLEAAVHVTEHLGGDSTGLRKALESLS